jgi:hypothetical protein
MWKKTLGYGHFREKMMIKPGVYTVSSDKPMFLLQNPWFKGYS